MTTLESYITGVSTRQLERDLEAATKLVTSKRNYSSRERLGFLEDVKILVAELDRRYRS